MLVTMAAAYGDFKHILITGASSGIGKAMAASYAAPGVTLSLSGRDSARLAAVAQACRERGASVDAASLDVTDRTAMAAWIDQRDQATALDLVIANAGVSAGLGESAVTTRRIFSTNLDGVLNTVLPALDAFRRRRRGHIALISSLASFRGMDSAPAYCASKAAIRVWGEGLRGALAPENIGVTVVCPGFVVSRITDANTFPMPYLMSAEQSADIIQRGIAANRGRVAFPWPMWAAVWVLSLLPDSCAGAIARMLPKKS